MPLRVLVHTAITVVTTPVVFFKKLSTTRHTLTAVEPPRDRRMVAILLIRDCTAVVLRRHGGDGGAIAVLVRYHGGHGGATAVMAVPRRSHCGSAQPAVACGCFEHVQSFRRAPAMVRSFDSFPRCYGDH